jgi:DNA helicase-2/ATP-dependent DNA helicase PcrA
MTRAKDRLYLTRAAARRVFGSLRFNDPSRFFHEIPEELSREVSPRGGGGAPEAAGRRAPRTWLRKGRGGGTSRAREGERRIDTAYDQTGEYGEDREMPLSDLADVYLEMGTRVRHPNLGQGRSERVEEGRQARVVIRFDRAGAPSCWRTRSWRSYSAGSQNAGDPRPGIRGPGRGRPDHPEG